MEKDKVKILVLGADGFIGSSLVKSLLMDGGYFIRAFDLFRNGQTRNLKEIQDDIELFSGNFLNHDDIKRALIDIDYVFHFISLTTPGSSMSDPLVDIDTNIRGTIALLNECACAGVKRVIFSSSGGAIYGNSDRGCFREDDATNPISPYAISKLTIEKYLEYYRINKGLDYLILRYANPYGPGQNVVGSQGIIPIFLNLIRQGKEITIFGDGENVRDYIYIDDLITITKLLFAKETDYRIYNIGSGEGTTINKVVEIMKDVVEKKVQVDRQSNRNIDVRKIVLNIERMLNETGYVSMVSLKDGIEKTWNKMNE